MTMKKKFAFSLLVLFVLVCFALPAMAAEQGEYPEDPFTPYETNLHGIVGPARFFIWDAPLFYSENYSRVMKWEVEVKGGDLGTANLSFYTNPFSLGKYKFLVTKMKFPVSTIPSFISISKFSIHLCLMVLVVMIFIVTGHYPDVYWPKTGCDLRLYVNRK